MRLSAGQGAETACVPADWHTVGRSKLLYFYKTVQLLSHCGQANKHEIEVLCRQICQPSPLISAILDPDTTWNVRQALMLLFKNVVIFTETQVDTAPPDHPSAIDWQMRRLYRLCRQHPSIGARTRPH